MTRRISVRKSRKKKPSVLESTWLLSSLEIASLQADMGSRNRRDLQGIESLVEGEKSQAISMLHQEFCFRVTQSPHRQKWKGTGSTQFSFTALKQTSWHHNSPGFPGMPAAEPVFKALALQPETPSGPAPSALTWQKPYVTQPDLQYGCNSFRTCEQDFHYA